jgi:hypothetical protein
MSSIGGRGRRETGNAEDGLTTRHVVALYGDESDGRRAQGSEWKGGKGGKRVCLLGLISFRVRLFP